MIVTRRRTWIFTAVMAAMVIAVLLPTMAQAYSVTGVSYDPWRGSWGASIYVYGKGATDTDFTSPSLRNSVYLWKYEGGAWVIKQSAVGTKSNTNHLDVTVRHYHPSGGTFQIKTYHEWKWTGGSTYYGGWSRSNVRTV